MESKYNIGLCSVGKIVLSRSGEEMLVENLALGHNFEVSPIGTLSAVAGEQFVGSC